MPSEPDDLRDTGCLFTLVEFEDKAQEFVHLVSKFTSDIEWEVREGVPEGFLPVLDCKETPNWSVVAWPKGRPGYMQAYMDLLSTLGYLQELIELPSVKFPLEVVPC
jgi:hypothetical protein